MSLREVAAAADVNIGLIHHYIGNKGDLVTAVLEQLGTRRYDDLDDSELARTFAGYVTLSSPTVPERTKTMIQIRTILAGIDLRDHQSRFPIIEELYRRLSARTTPTDARVRTAFLVSALSGWLVFGPTALHSVGDDDLDTETLVERIAELVDELMLNADR